MDSGTSDWETTDEIRVNEKFVDTQHRFRDVDERYRACRRAC
jgi:hypothetical protein